MPVRWLRYRAGMTVTCTLGTGTRPRSPTSPRAPRTRRRVGPTACAWSRRVSPDGSSIWMVISELDDGATIEWDDDARRRRCLRDRAARSTSTAHRCPEDGAVIVESGVACTARAVGVTTVVALRRVRPGPPADGHVRRARAPAATACTWSATAAGSRRATGSASRCAGSPTPPARRAASRCSTCGAPKGACATGRTPTPRTS